MNAAETARVVKSLEKLFSQHGADEGEAIVYAHEFTKKLGACAYESLKPFFDLGWTVDEFMRWTWNDRQHWKKHILRAPAYERALLNQGCPTGFARRATYCRIALILNDPVKVSAAYKLFKPVFVTDHACAGALRDCPAAFHQDPTAIQEWVRWVSRHRYVPVQNLFHLKHWATGCDKCRRAIRATMPVTAGESPKPPSV